MDLETKAPGRRELELFTQVAGADALIDEGSKAYQGRGLGYMEFDPLEEIAGAPGLLRTPIVRSGRTITIGDDLAGWRRIADLESGRA